MTGIDEMFAALDGYDLYEDALYNWARWCREMAAIKNRANVKRWRKMNPAKFRAQNRRSSKTYAKRHPEKKRAAKARYREKYRIKHREWWRRNSSAYRARKQASGA